MSRFARQMRLAEIGVEGQARIAATAIAPSGSGFVREIEESYLRLAGARIALPEPAAVPLDLGLENAAARDVGEAALRALVGLRCALGIGS